MRYFNCVICAKLDLSTYNQCVWVFEVKSLYEYIYLLKYHAMNDISANQVNKNAYSKSFLWITNKLLILICMVLSDSIGLS